MKSHRPALILVTWLGFVSPPVGAAEKTAVPPDKAAAAGKLSGTSEFAAQVQKVQEQIAALSKHRQENPPPPDPAHNPFRLPSRAPVVMPTTAEGDTVPAGAEPVTSDSGPGASLALLQQSAATLKVVGTIELGDRTHIVINTRPYKEGDVVQTQVLGKTVYLRVKEIAKRSVTLSLNDAEMTLKY